MVIRSLLTCCDGAASSRQGSQYENSYPESASCGSWGPSLSPLWHTSYSPPWTALEMWRQQSRAWLPGSEDPTHSGQLFSAQLGHEGVLMPSNCWTYHLENLLQETLFLQCSAQAWNSLEVKIPSFSEWPTGKGSAHSQAECEALGKASSDFQ